MIEKIKTLEEIRKIIDEARNQNKKIVTTNGIFDILHAGHIKLLEYAKSLGDILIVLANNDVSAKKYKGDDRPIFSEDHRIYVLSSISFVDYIILFEEARVMPLLEKLKPDMHVKGKTSNYSGLLDDKKVVEKNGGKMIIFDSLLDFSTTKIIEKLI